MKKKPDETVVNDEHQKMDKNKKKSSILFSFFFLSLTLTQERMLDFILDMYTQDLVSP